MGAKGAYKQFYFLLFFSFLLSMRLWIGWDGRAALFNYIICSFLILLYISGRIRLAITIRHVVAFLLFFLAHVITQKSPNFYVILFLAIQDIPVLFILSLDDKRKVECLEYITKYLSIILIPGIVLFTLLNMVDFPPLNTICLDSADIGIKEDSYLYRYNYIFFEPSAYSRDIDLYGYLRFNGPFSEPGHLGMICAFLLYANQFDFKKKKYLWILVLSIVLSLSLAGYVLAFLGFILVKFYEGKISLPRLVILSLIIGGIYYGSTSYNNGDNILNNVIFSRLQYDAELGISGNNRASGLLYDYYLYMMQGDTHAMLYGYDAETIKMLTESGGRGTGFVYWMVLYGIVGIVTVAAFYVYLLLTSKNRKFAILSFIMICLMFVQRSYPFWSSWVIIYVYGIALAERRNSLVERQRESGVTINNKKVNETERFFI